MYTLDEFIDRLRELRKVAGSGNLPVTVPMIDPSGHEVAAAELCNVMPPTGDGDERTWKISIESDENTEQIVSVF